MSIYIHIYIYIRFRISREEGNKRISYRDDIGIISPYSLCTSKINV